MVVVDVGGIALIIFVAIFHVISTRAEAKSVMAAVMFPITDTAPGTKYVLNKYLLNERMSCSR